MNLKEFKDKHLGKQIDFDGAYGGQCVDLFRQYNQDVLKINQPKGVVGAKDFWFNFESDSNLNGNFERIKNTPEFLPQEGDVMVWDKWSNNPYGHVAIILEATLSDFKSLDQNWNGIQKVLEVKHTYGRPKVLGVLRPELDSSKQLKDRVIDFDDAEGKRHTVGWYVREWAVEKEQNQNKNTFVDKIIALIQRERKSS